MAKNKKRPELNHCKVRLSTHPKAPWRVSYPAEREGKSIMLRKTFSKEDDAWKFAAETDLEISNHGIRFGAIPPEVRRAFDFYRDERITLEAAGATVPRFEDLIVTAITGIRKEHEARARVAVAEAVETFTAYKATRVGSRQQTDIKDRLKRFSQEFGDRSVASITTAEIETWLSSLRSRRNPGKQELPPLLGPLTRNHYRAILHAFFSYGTAPARAWCDRNPVADLEPEAVETGEPQAYSPEDAAKIMQTALESKPELVPVLALGMFAGLRVSEAVTVDLAKITATTEEFRVTGKTGPRMAPCTAACVAWIHSQKRRKGPAWTQSARSLVDAMQDLFTLAKVDQIDNGARHSFISYRTAETRDVARVADECGNSVGTIKNHYRQLVTAEQATQYFAIRPEAPAANITGIETGRAIA
jgi:site-specific recombinase XerD